MNSISAGFKHGKASRDMPEAGWDSVNADSAISPMKIERNAAMGDFEFKQSASNMV